MTMYKIVRHYFKGYTEVVKTGLTLEEAQEHCSDPETSSSTCEGKEACALTRRVGQWFDGYDEDSGQPRL